MQKKQIRHYGLDELVAFHFDKLDTTTNNQIRVHLDHCEQCNETNQTAIKRVELEENQSHANHVLILAPFGQQNQVSSH